MSTLSSFAPQVIFGNLPSSDESLAVARRIRAVIGLGLLTSGDRLPKAADLARNFGISSSTLKEALGVLRAEGLIETRAGKYGGSFVKRTPKMTSLARAQVARFSSAELRDLGDWRQMIVTQEAELAARRAAEANVTRLAGYAEQVAEADTAEHARRAHGRFHLELAAAGQSIRLSNAEFAMHDELDWLFGLVLADHDARQTAAEGLRKVVDAVSAQDSAAARSAARVHILEMVDALARLRLDIIAAQQNRSDADAANVQALDHEVASFLSSIIGQLRPLAAAAGPILAEVAEVQEIRTRISLSILPLFQELPTFIQGVGVMADVGVVPGHPYWINWWHPTSSGPAENLHHVLDPDDENFYDYEAREFIAVPRDTHQDWVTGPYVDYGGVNEYIVTVSAPIMSAERFVGVATVDILVADLEHRFSSWLAAVDGTCVVLNAENRVVISNSIAYDVGDVVKTSPSDRVVPVGLFGWSVVTNPSRTAVPADHPR